MRGALVVLWCVLGCSEPAEAPVAADAGAADTGPGQDDVSGVDVGTPDVSPVDVPPLPEDAQDTTDTPVPVDAVDQVDTTPDVPDTFADADVPTADTVTADTNAEDASTADTVSDDTATADTSADDDTPPALTVTAPSEGAVVAGGFVEVTGTAVDPEGPNGAAPGGDVEVWLGGAQVPVAADGSFTWTVTGLDAGVATVVVRARDAAGNTAEVSRTLTVTAKQVGLRVREASEGSLAGVVSVGSLAPVPVVVEALWDGGRVTTLEGPLALATQDPLVATASPAGLITGVGAGRTVLTATSGSFVATADVMVRIDGDAPGAPRVMTYLPTTNQPVQAWMGTAEPRASLSISGAASPVTALVSDYGHFQVNVPLELGLNEITVTVTDVAGNSSLPFPFPIAYSPATRDAGRLHESDGDLQSGALGEWLMHPLVVRATREDGAPLGMSEVTFEVVDGDASLAVVSAGDTVGDASVPGRLTVITDAEGRARVWARLGTAANSRILARLAGDTGLPVLFQARAQVAGGGLTRLSGLVLDDDLRGVSGATVFIETEGLLTTTDERGAFELVWTAGNTPPAPLQVPVLVDGTNAESGRHASIEFRLDVVPGLDNKAPRPLFIPRLPQGVVPKLDAQGVVTETLVLERSFAPGVLPTRVTVPAGTRITWPAGLPASEQVLRIVDVPQGRTPMPLPDGLYAGHTIAVQPASTIFDPPLPIALPNVDGLAPGEAIDLMSFDHDAVAYLPVGSLSVTPEGQYLVSGPGSGIRVGAWHSGPARRAPEACQPAGEIGTCSEGATPSKPRDCTCLGPSGKAFPCEEGRPFTAPPQPCSGQSQRIEVVCDLEKKKKIQIVDPEKDSTGVVKVPFDVEVTFKCQTDPPELAQGVKWFLGESFLGTGPNVPLKLPSGTEPGKVYVVTAQLADTSESDRVVVRPCPCCTAGTVTVCGDSITLKEKAGVGGAGDVFLVSGNAIMSNDGDLFLRSDKPVECKPKLTKVSSDGTLSMDTRDPSGIFALPNVRLYTGDWEIDGTNGEITVSPTGNLQLSLLGFPLTDTEKAPVMGKDSVGFPVPSLGIEFGGNEPGESKVAVKFDAITVTTPRITISGEFSYEGELALIRGSLFLRRALLKYDSVTDVFGGALGLGFREQPGQFGFELEGTYREGLVKSIKGTLTFGTTALFPTVRGLPIPPTGTPPIAFLRKASLAVDNPGYFIGKGGKNDLPAVTGTAEFGIGPAFAGPCDEYTVAVVETEAKINTKPVQLDLGVKGSLLNITPIAFCTKFFKSVVGFNEEAKPLGNPSIGLIGIDGKMTAQFSPNSRVSVQAGARVRAPTAFNSELVSVTGDILTGSIKGMVETTQGLDFGVEVAGVLNLPALKVGPFATGGFSIANVKFTLAGGGPPFRFNAELAGIFRGIPPVRILLKLSTEGSKFSVCVFSICSGSVELERVAFAGGAVSLDVPAGLSGVELSLGHASGTDARFSVIAPDGTRYDPDDLGAYDQGAYFLAGLDPEVTTWLITDPAPGTWRIVDVSPLDAITEAIVALPDQAPSFAFDEPFTRVGATVVVGYAASDADSDTGIQFVATPTRELSDGVTIGRAQVSDAATSFEWDTAGVAPGLYFVCAVLDDPAAVGGVVCSKEPVAVEGESVVGPALVRARPVPGGIEVSWLPTASNDGSVVTLRPAFEGEPVTASGATSPVVVLGAVSGAPYDVVVTENGVTSAPVRASAGGVPAPFFRSAAPLAAMAGQPYSYDPDVSGVLSLELGPPGAKVSGGVLTATFDKGPVPIVLRASGPGGVTLQSFEVQVAHADAMVVPAILGRPEGHVQLGVPFSFSPELVAPSDLPAVELVMGPPGMALSPAGVITWTPTLAEALASPGSFAFTVRATGEGGVAERTFTLTLADRDGDGLTDDYERASGLDPRSATPSSGDPDGDGLDHAEEQAAGTRGDLGDTDGDLLEDGAELSAGADPRRADTDGDGLSDGEEAKDGTSPTLEDTDGDGASDASEKAMGADPKLKADTDGDGLSDDRELELGSSPELADEDGDGLNDAAELGLGTDPKVADSDGDGVSDSLELAMGSRPNDAGGDSDGDGLLDDRELAEGSDPTLSDSDGDGFLDAIEVATGSDPGSFGKKPDIEQIPLEPQRSQKAVGQSEPVPFRPFEVVDVGFVGCILDDDLDGAPNSFEEDFGFSSSNPADGLSDGDGDGIPMWQEAKLGTDPTKADTDGDNVPDGQEQVDGTDPKDPKSFGSAGPIVALEVAPDKATLVSNTLLGTAQLQLITMGRRADGSKTDVSAATKGTAYTPSAPGLLAVGPNGLVSHVSGSGTAEVAVQNGALSKSVPVTVTTFAPTAIAAVDLPGVPGPLAVDGDWLVVGVDDALFVADVADPAAMALRGRLELGQPARDVVLEGGLALVSRAAGVTAVQILDPDAPAVTLHIPTAAPANAAAMADGFAFVATDKGIHTVRLDVPGVELIDANGDGTDDRVVGTLLTSSAFTAIDQGFGRVVASTGGGALATFARLPQGALEFGGQVVVGGVTRGVRIEGATTFVVAGTEVYRVSGAQVTGSSSGVLAAGPLASSRGTLLVGRQNSNDLLGFLGTGLPSSLPALGSIGFAGLGDVTHTTGLGARGMVHFIAAWAPAGDRRLLLSGRHDLAVDNLGVPPVLAWISPMPGARVEEGQLFEVSLSATDDVAVSSVSVAVGEAPPVTLERPPFRLTIRAPSVSAEQDLVVSASAVDPGGNVATLDPLAVRVLPVLDTVPPDVAFVAPEAGAVASAGMTLPVVVNAFDDRAVTSVVVRVDGKVAAELNAPPWTAQITLGAPGPGGQWTLEASATDVGGNTSTATRAVANAGTDLVGLGISHIAEGDTTFDGQDVVIAGGTVRIDGSHTFKKVTVMADGVLSHTAATITTETRMALTADSIVVDGAIDVRGRGYVGGCFFDNGCPGTTFGRTIGNTAGGNGSASHGGIGRGGAGPVYGDFAEPITLGSGGGGGGIGGAGGGAVWLDAAIVTVRGAIRADAGDEPGDHDEFIGGPPDVPGNGGSGGSIFVRADVLDLSGTLSARGGDSSPAATARHGGGGGRIAVVAGSLSLSGVLAVAGGVSKSTVLGSDGAVGTLFIDEPLAGPTLIVDDAVGDVDNPVFGSSTTVPFVGRGDVHVVLRGKARVTLHAPLVAASLSLEDTSLLTHPATTAALERGLVVTVQDLLIGAGARVDVSGRGYLGTTTIGNVFGANGTAGQRAGGSHGGRGGGIPGRVYGDPFAPSALGAGGGNSGEVSSDRGGAGGGRIRIDADACVIEGALRADGAAGPAGSAGGGAGGSIWIRSDLIEGSGAISADGGAGGPTNTAGGGSGGRIRLESGDFAFDRDSVSARGAATHVAGGPGSIVWPTADGTELRVDNGGVVPANAAPLLTELGASRVNGTPAAGSMQFTLLISAPILDQQLVGATVTLGTLGPFEVVANTLTTITVDTGGPDLKTIGVVGNQVVRAQRSLPATVVLAGAARVLMNDHLTAEGLRVEGGAVVTHSAAKVSEPELGLRLTASGPVVIDSTGAIDVSAVGFAGQYVPTLGTSGAAATFGNLVHFLPKTVSGSGGSYGGMGGGTSPGDVYGGPIAPDSCGGGGGGGATNAAAGGTGGGRVRIDAGSFVCDGAVRADGGPSGTGGDQKGGGGAGGAIWITAETIDVGGEISAMGGDGGGAGGGGGRVHLEATAGPVVAAAPNLLGGVGPVGRGGPGTFFSRGAGAPAVLTVDGAGLGAMNAAPLFGQVGRRLASNQSTAGKVVIQSGGPWFVNGLVGMELRCDGIAGTFTITANDQSGLTVDPADGSTLAITNNMQCTGLHTLPAQVVLRGGVTVLVDDALEVEALELDGGTLTHSATVPSSGGDGALELMATGEIRVGAGSSVDVSGRGFAGDCVFNVNCGSGGYTTGNRQTGGSKTSSGGSHGGKGGGASAGAAYGDPAAPVKPGGGGARGATSTEAGGSGGGVIRLTGESVIIDGAVIADGRPGAAAGAQSGGGGAGGTVRIAATTLSGSGSVTANGGAGGSGGGGGGGGGRIRISSTNSGGWLPALLSAAGASGTHATAPNGEAGTVMGP